jgi:hypothetical protein
MAGHGTTTGLDLASGNTAAASGLQTELTETDIAAAEGETTVAALHLLAKFSSLWL